MAVRLIKTDTFTTDVVIRQPGSTEDEGFKATFKALPDDTVRDLLADLRNGRITQDQMLGQVLVKVAGIQDETGKDVDADTALSWVRSNVGAANACGIAYMREVSGISEKNAQRSRGR
jgi:hypothetical protein